jgi:NAD(P)-binding Rossmann-like domain
MTGSPNQVGHNSSVAIVGAGLSGLCLAQSLLRAGFDVQVYERDPSPDARRKGYRITVHEHGIAALQRCLPPHLFELFLATVSPPGQGGWLFSVHQMPVEGRLWTSARVDCGPARSRARSAGERSGGEPSKRTVSGPVPANASKVKTR